MNHVVIAPEVLDRFHELAEATHRHPRPLPRHKSQHNNGHTTLLPHAA